VNLQQSYTETLKQEKVHKQEEDKIIQKHFNIKPDLLNLKLVIFTFLNNILKINAEVYS